MKTSKQMPILLVVMVYMEDILLCRNKRVHWWNPLKFYWSLIALELVRGHCTDNHGKLTLLNRKLVWKIAERSFAWICCEAPFHVFFWVLFWCSVPVWAPDFGGIRTWVDQPCWKAQLRLVVGRIPGKTALGFRWFVRSSQPGLRPPKRRTERPSQVGALREKMAIFFPIS